jgi:Anti-sigma factor NepR
MGRPTHRKSEVRLGREVQARIGQQLRALYDEVVKEGVPDHINDLVLRLSEQDDPAA